MDTTNIKEIDFTLTNKNGKEELITNLDGNDYSIDFTSDNQTNLRNFFMVVLKLLKKEKFHFKFVKSNEVKNEMIIKVSLGYIIEINKEIDSILQKIESATNV